MTPASSRADVHKSVIPICQQGHDVLLIWFAAGLGWLPFWHNPWNKFDFVLVWTSVLDTIYSLSLTEAQAKMLGVQKLLRLLRLLRMFKLVKSIKVRRWRTPGHATNHSMHVRACCHSEILGLSCSMS